jgi:hypothetical protein
MIYYFCRKISSVLQIIKQWSTLLFSRSNDVVSTKKEKTNTDFDFSYIPQTKVIEEEMDEQSVGLVSPYKKINLEKIIMYSYF